MYSFMKSRGSPALHMLFLPVGALARAHGAPLPRDSIMAVLNMGRS